MKDAQIEEGIMNDFIFISLILIGVKAPEMEHYVKNNHD